MAEEYTPAHPWAVAEVLAAHRSAAARVLTAS